jgi:hypothetical protein
MSLFIPILPETLAPTPLSQVAHPHANGILADAAIGHRDHAAVAASRRKSAGMLGSVRAS